MVELKSHLFGGAHAAPNKGAPEWDRRAPSLRLAPRARIMHIRSSRAHPELPRFITRERAMSRIAVAVAGIPASTDEAKQDTEGRTTSAVNRVGNGETKRAARADCNEPCAGSSSVSHVECFANKRCWRPGGSRVKQMMLIFVTTPRAAGGIATGGMAGAGQQWDAMPPPCRRPAGMLAARPAVECDLAPLPPPLPSTPSPLLPTSTSLPVPPPPLLAVVGASPPSGACRLDGGDPSTCAAAPLHSVPPSPPPYTRRRHRCRLPLHRRRQCRQFLRRRPLRQRAPRRRLGHAAWTEVIRRHVLRPCTPCDPPCRPPRRRHRCHLPLHRRRQYRQFLRRRPLRQRRLAAVCRGMPHGRRRSVDMCCAPALRATLPASLPAAEPTRGQTASRERLRKRVGRGVERPRGERGVRRRMRAASGAGSMQGAAGVVARAQGAMRGAGAHLQASTAASSGRRRP